jgi:hypothetical protein
MLSSYKASVAFLREHRSALGPAHRSIVSTTNSELLHLTKLFRDEPLSSDARQEVTAVMAHLTADSSAVFSEAERQQLIEISASRLSSSCDEVNPAGHGSQKSQTHIYSHKYLSNDQWEYILDLTIAFATKQTFLSKIWLGWGLRFPSGPTFRHGLALLTVASKLADCSPAHMHEHVMAFQKEFRKLRELYPGQATMKSFPALPTDFKQSHPTLLGDIIECRVSEASITEMAHSTSIPLKLTNSSLQQSPRAAGSSVLALSAAPRTSSAIQGDFLRNLLSMAMGNSPVLALPSPEQPRTKRRIRPSLPTVDDIGPAPSAPLALRDHPAAIDGSDSAAPAAPIDRNHLADGSVELSGPDSAEEGPAQPAELSEDALSLLDPAGHAAQTSPIDQIAQQTAAFIQARKDKKKAEKEAAAAAAGKITRRIWGKNKLAIALKPSPKPKSKNKRKRVAAPKPKPAATPTPLLARPADATVQFGCKSCRGAVKGCKTCRRPAFAGWRGNHAAWQALGLT